MSINAIRAAGSSAAMSQAGRQPVKFRFFRLHPPQDSCYQHQALPGTHTRFRTRRYSAAVYAARANLKPVLITGMAQGGS